MGIGVGALVIGMLALLIYFLPAIVASKKDHPNSASIFVLNLLLGWTFVGWVAALVWAYSSSDAATGWRDPALLADDIVQVPLNRQCPFCAETIKTAAKICRFCNREISQSPPGE